MKTLFRALWIALPLVPAALLLGDASGDPSTWFADGPSAAWSLSALLGVAAATWAAGQLALAARPFGLAKLLGTDKLLSFHAFMAVLLCLAAAAHLALKLFVLGYPLGLQALLGAGALLLFALASAGAWAFLSPKAAKRHPGIAALRKSLQESKGATYKRFRLVHNLVLLPFLIAPLHAMLSSALPFSPAALWTLGGWYLLCAALQARYRVRGRKA